MQGRSVRRSAKLAGLGALAAALLTAPFVGSAQPVPESCAYWQSRPAADWYGALEEARSQWDTIEVSFGDNVFENQYRVSLFVETYGPISQQEAYFDLLTAEPERAAGLTFDAQGRAIDPGAGLSAELDRRTAERARYEVLRDGVNAVYCACEGSAGQDPDAQKVCELAASLAADDRGPYAPD